MRDPTLLIAESVMQTSNTELNRRQFLHGVLGSAAFSTAVHAAGSDEIKVGLIGCGGRGTGALTQCVQADPAVRITSLGDAFKDQIESCRTKLKAEPITQSRFHADDDHCFVGLESYRRVIDGVDVVILAAPSGFRPLHVTAAIAAGKHVFAEKSGAVDSTGVRTLLAAYEMATQKRVSVVGGLQRRYQNSYAETIRRIQGGAIGELKTGQCIWMGGGYLEPKNRQRSWSDVEYQIRNWFYYTWLSGGFITDQNIHNLDAMNWALNSHPLKAIGRGERRKFNDASFGNILDHFVVTYSYPQNITIEAECGIKAGDEAFKVTETLTGTAGTCELIGKISASNSERWNYKEPRKPDPYQVEFDVLLKSIRDGKPKNDLKILADSALTAIMGRMAAYTGEEVTWEQALNSPEDLMPRNLSLGLLAVAPIPNPKNTPIPRSTGNGDKYALLVGVRNYDKNELKNLKYSEPDISGLSATLLKLGYHRENVVSMTQTRGAEDDRFLPRAENIRRELRLLLKGLTENDSVIVGFAGHGVQFRNETEAYFCPSGTKLADKTTLISLGEVYAELEKCPAKFKLLISDACRNDPRTSNARSLSDVDLDSVTRPQKRIPPGGIAALFSCSAGEEAFEHDDLKHGVFYHFVIKGLEGEADTDGDGVVTLPELENYVKKRVFNYVRAEYGREQMPDFVGRVKGLVPLVELKK